MPSCKNAVRLDNLFASPRQCSESLPSRVGRAQHAAAPIAPGSLPVVNSTSSGAEQQCTGCHGARDAQPQNVTIPRLAGQSSTYLVRQLSAFYWGRRKDLTSPPSRTNMNRISLELNDRTMASLADYFADQLQAKGASISEFDPQRKFPLLQDSRMFISRCSCCATSAGNVSMR